ncbi:arabinogalactan protein 13 [Elaeis guineensis]|uniref:Arabinogalactan protein 13 n=1 Tax=Elaeis guineensis var. tenera TaxID=51953 RepID=A0A6I9S7K0_ELAGV|nr:arabinogalactan protein 13 [Elaeis guineensis]
MEAGLKLRFFAVAMLAVVMASSLVEKAAAADAPAPSPTSGASVAAPAAALASLATLAFGYLFC